MFFNVVDLSSYQIPRIFQKEVTIIEFPRDFLSKEFIYWAP